MFSTLHKLLVDDLAGIVLPSLDVDCLLDNSICSTSKRTTCPVLEGRQFETRGIKQPNVALAKRREMGHTWQGTVAV